MSGGRETLTHWQLVEGTMTFHIWFNGGAYQAGANYSDGSTVSGQARDWFPSYRSARASLWCKGRMKKETP